MHSIIPETIPVEQGHFSNKQARAPADFRSRGACLFIGTKNG